MDTKRKYRIFLNLSEGEAEALARLARVEMRDMQTQAHFFVREKLIEAGMIPAVNPDNVFTNPFKSADEKLKP